MNLAKLFRLFSFFSHRSPLNRLKIVLSAFKSAIALPRHESRTLEQMEAELSDPRFFGVHNSYIVNLAHVCGLKKRFSDDEIPHLLLRECTAEIPVSKVRLAPLRDGLEKLFNASGDLKKMAIVNL